MPSQDHVRDSYRIEGVGDGSTHMAFSHRVGRSLCMTMCTGFGLFLISVGFYTLFSETQPPCPLEDLFLVGAPAPPDLDLGELGDGELECNTPPVQDATCSRGPSTEPTDACEDFVAGGTCPSTCEHTEQESGRAFVVYRNQRTSQDSGPSHFVCVGWDEVDSGWKLLIGGGGGFNPRASDVLVASYGEDEFASGEGVRETVGGTGAANGLTFGYAAGDLEVTEDPSSDQFDFLVNGTFIVAHQPAAEATPPPPPCHNVPPGGASSPGWFAFGGAILVMAMMVGGLRGGCKYEEVELDKTQTGVVITISRRACMCLESLRRMHCLLLRTPETHTLSLDAEAAQCDYEADGGVCSGAITCGKSVVVANSYFENADGSITQGLDVERTVQIWNGPPLSMSAAKRLQKQINAFLNPHRVEKRETVKFDGPEWKGAPKRDGDDLERSLGGGGGGGGGGSPTSVRRPRSPVRGASSFGSHLRQPPRLSSQVRAERQKVVDEVRTAGTDGLLGDLQQAREVYGQLLGLRRQTIANGRPVTPELDMLLRNMDKDMQQIETKLRISGQEVPLNRLASVSSAEDVPGPPPGASPPVGRPQAGGGLPAPPRQTFGSSEPILPSPRPTGTSTAGMEQEQGPPLGEQPPPPQAATVVSAESESAARFRAGLAGMAQLEQSERMDDEDDQHQEQEQPQDDGVSEELQEDEEQNEEHDEEGQLLEAPALSVGGSDHDVDTTKTSALPPPALAPPMAPLGSGTGAQAVTLPPLKPASSSSGFGGTASMLARLSAFKAEKEKAVSATTATEGSESGPAAILPPVLPALASPEEDVNDDDDDDDAASDSGGDEPEELEAAEAAEGVQDDATEQQEQDPGQQADSGEQRQGEEEEEREEDVDASKEGDGRDAPGGEAEAAAPAPAIKAKTDTAKRRAELMQKRKVETAKKKKKAAAAAAAADAGVGAAGGTPPRSTTPPRGTRGADGDTKSDATAVAAAKRAAQKKRAATMRAKAKAKRDGTPPRAKP
jgi:hypothetical protein